MAPISQGGAKLGMGMKLFRNTAADYDTPTWVEVGNVRDLTLNLTSSQADATTRGNNGWRAMVAALKDGSVDFEMIYDPEDTDGWVAFRDAYDNKTPQDIAISDDSMTPADIPTGENGTYFRAVFTVQTFTQSEPLEDIVTNAVNMTPTYVTDPAQAPKFGQTVGAG